VTPLAAGCRAINCKKAKLIGRTKKSRPKSKSENENARRGGDKEAPAEPLAIRYLLLVICIRPTGIKTRQIKIIR
jgi:hypothetical protein